MLECVLWESDSLPVFLSSLPSGKDALLIFKCGHVTGLGQGHVSRGDDESVPGSDPFPSHCQSAATSDSGCSLPWPQCEDRGEQSPRPALKGHPAQKRSKTWEF